MKRLLYLLAAFVLLSSSSYAIKKQFIIGNTAGAGTQVYVGDARNIDNVYPNYVVKDVDVKFPVNEKGDLPELLRAEIDTVLNPVFVPARRHPYPQNMGEQDTARIISSRSDPTNKWYLGDRTIPINVVNQEGETVFNLNGFAQFFPSIKSVFPELKSGTFRVDSVLYSPYAYPSRPIQYNDFAFFFSTMDPNDMGKAQWTINQKQYTVTSVNVDYYDVVDNARYYKLFTPNELNSKIEDQGGGSFSINRTSVRMADDPGFTPEDRTLDIDQPFLFMIGPEDFFDMSDTLEMIGAWEWGLANTEMDKALAGAVAYYVEGDTARIRTLSTTVAPPSPRVPTDYPQIENEVICRMNYTMWVVGEFDGILDTNPQSVGESTGLVELLNVAPNPVRDAATIRFSLNESTNARLTLTNSLGQTVDVLVDKYMTPGTYEIPLDASLLNSGTYYYSLRTENDMITRILQVSK